MAYIQVLVIVLCSCFIQNAFAVTPGRPSKRVVRSQQTLTGGASETKQTESKRSEAAAAEYTNLAKVESMVWSTWEDINRTNEAGKTITRDVRNAIREVLSDQQFWSSTKGTVERHAKYTRDARRAEKKVNTCNAVTRLMTSPVMSQGLLEVVDEVYDMVVRADTGLLTDTLQLTTDVVNGGSVTIGLDVFGTLVEHVSLNPDVLSKFFAMLKKMLRYGGVKNMSDGVAGKFMKVTSRLSNQTR